MRTLRKAAAGAVLFGSMLLLPAATEAQHAAMPGIPGYLDPATGSFIARANLQPNAAAKQVGGTITVTTTVFLDSTIPAGLPITCTVSIGTFDDVATNSAGGSNQVVRTGGKATCTTTITFLWEIDPVATKAMGLGVSVSVGNFGTDQSRSVSTSISVPLSTKRKSVTLAM
jgi:hypothetical protein